jgi:hypothetical protein
MTQINLKGNNMSTKPFKKTAIASAVVGALASSGAYAVDLTNSATFPKRAGSTANTVFLGANGTKVRFKATEGTSTETLIQARVYYYDDAGNPVGSPSLPATDTDSTAGQLQIDIPVGTPTGATKAIIVVLKNGATDDIAGGNPASFIKPDGTLDTTGYANEAAAVTAAVTANAFLPIDSAYQTISVVDAKVDTVSSPKVLYVTFNAIPNIARGDSLAKDTKVSVVEGLGATPVISSKESGITGSLPNDVMAFVDKDGTNANNTVLGSLNAFGASISSVSNAAGLDDGAGNTPSDPATISPVTALAAPAYNAAGKVMVATTAGSVDDLYGNTGVASVTLNIRLDEEPDPTSWDVADAFVSAGTVAGVGITADADGKNTILQATVNAGGTNKFFADPATGELLHGADRDTAVPFKAQVKKETGDELALKLNNSVKITADLALEQVYVGVAQAPQALTVDSDLNGYIDGIKIDFKQPINGLTAGANLGLISYLNDSDLQGSEVARPIVLATDTPALDSNSVKVTLKLTNPDVPVDGKAPPVANVNNDYNADGKIDQQDADLVTDAHLDTAAENVMPGAYGVGGGDLPFSAEIGINTAAAKADNSKVETSLTYQYAYNPQTGDNLKVATTRFSNVADGASPVVKRVEYVETDDGKASKRDPSGTVTIVASENLANQTPNVGEFLFNNKPVSLINLDANMDDKAIANNPTGTSFTIENVPGTVFGQLLSLGIEPNVFDTNSNALVLSSNATQNTVAAPQAAAPRMVSATPVHAAASLKWNKVKVEFDQDVAKADTATDLSGLFVVRARVGAARGAAFENRDPGTVSDDAYYDFRIPASNVQINGQQVTLTLPIEDFPADTLEIWVDYQGATQAEIDAGDVNYLKSVATGTPADPVNDTLFEDLGTNTEVPESADPDTAGFDVADVDADTVKANLPPLFLATNGTDNHRNIFVQTIKGTVKRGTENLIDGAGVRVDLVRLEPGKVNKTFAEKAVVGDGYIDVRRGANSDGNTNTPTGTAGQSGAPNNQGNNTGADQWQTIALKNELLKATTLDDVAKRKQKFAALNNLIAKLESENAPLSEIEKQKAQRAQAIDDFEALYGNVNSPVLNGYVKVTTGSGKTSSAGNNDVNSNANVGRTATLIKSVANKQEDGTTIYPVTIDLVTGAISSPAGNNSVQNGQLHLKQPVLATETTDPAHYKVLDTAWALVENGQYKAVVGMEQSNPTAKTSKLAQGFDDAFILVSVKDTTTGKWVLTNSADPSFDSYKPFGADIESDLSNPNRNIHNIDLDKVARVQLYGGHQWETFGIPGEMARDSAQPLDVNRFFITVNENDGRPVTVWHLDSGSNEMLFTLGLAEQPNAVQLRFELGGGGNSEVKTIGEIKPATGSAFAYLGDGDATIENFAVHNNGTNYSDDGVLDDTIADGVPLFVPLAATTAALDLSTSGWHLISLQQDESIKSFVDSHAGVDAAIAFVNQGSGDGVSKNVTYFSGDDVNAAELNEVLPAGQALFVHVQ